MERLAGRPRRGRFLQAAAASRPHWLAAGLPTTMVEIDRSELLRAIDRRHDDLVRQLDELNERIEQTLSRSGASRPEPAPAQSPSPCRS